MALVDSGSDLTFLREDKFTEIGSVEFTKTIKRAEGAGNGKIRIIGAFVGEINVDDVVCNIKIHVVPTGAIPNECILGKNVLSNVEVIVRKRKVVKMVQIHEDEEKGKTKRSAEQEDDTRSVDGENAEAVCEEDIFLKNLHKELRTGLSSGALSVERSDTLQYEIFLIYLLQELRTQQSKRVMTVQRLDTLILA
ncbi:hypothetical protein M0802_015406 [Mischocyttarus mexicanus]|nr:hypothetical protein M0802_015406 [Mischocyttarus mexicanus]